MMVVLRVHNDGFENKIKSNNHQFLFVISWKLQGFWSLWTTKIDSFLVFLKTWNWQLLDFDIHKVASIKKIECLLNTNLYTLFQGLVLPFDLQPYCVLIVPCICYFGTIDGSFLATKWILLWLWQTSINRWST